MGRTIFKFNIARAITLGVCAGLLVQICSTRVLAQSRKDPVDGPAWMAAAASAPFSQRPLHGKIDGIDFNPASAETYFQDAGASADGAIKNEKVSIKDGGGRQIDITIFGVKDFVGTMYSQSPVLKIKGASKLKVESALSNVPDDHFGMRISFGKVSKDFLQPVYIVLRQDRDNWLEGYVYATAVSTFNR